MNISPYAAFLIPAPFLTVIGIWACIKTYQQNQTKRFDEMKAQAQQAVVAAKVSRVRTIGKALVVAGHEAETGTYLVVNAGTRVAKHTGDLTRTPKKS